MRGGVWSVNELEPGWVAWPTTDGPYLHALEVDRAVDPATGELVVTGASGWVREQIAETETFAYRLGALAAEEVAEVAPSRNGSELHKMALTAHRFLQTGKAWLSWGLETLDVLNVVFWSEVPGAAPWKPVPWGLMAPGDTSDFAVAAPGVQWWEPAGESHYLAPDVVRLRGGVVLERRYGAGTSKPLEVRVVQHTPEHGFVHEWCEVGATRPLPGDAQENWRLLRMAVQQLVTPYRPGRGGGVAPAKRDWHNVACFSRHWRETLRAALELGAVLTHSAVVEFVGAA